MARKRNRHRAPLGRPPERSARYEDQVARWILRALVRAGAARAYVADPGELDAGATTLLRSLGITPAKGAKLAGSAALHSLRARLSELERAELAPALATENARLLAGLLGLNRTETELLAFTIALEAEEGLRECFAALRGRCHGVLCKHLALVLGLRVSDVDRALAPQAALRSVPVLSCTRIDVGYEGPLGLSDALEPVLMRPLASEHDLLRHFLTPAPAAGLALADYPHLAADVDLLARYLRAALARRKRGVNVLLHGPPGTGKTQLARALAEALGAELHEVNLEDSDQDAHAGSARLQAYALCQRFLRRRKHTLLLLDEVEDVFPKVGELQFGFRADSTLTKAWTNRLLEQNPIPAFWISNAIDQIDRAYVRRFDLVLEVGQPPRKVRRNVLDKHLSGLRLRPEYLDGLAELEELSPAHVQRAAAVVELLRPTSAVRAQADLERVVQNNLRAFSPRARRGTRARNEVAYDFGFINADADLAALELGVRSGKRGALCFYGPPGTGKTELARQLAREAELPVHEHRASGLLDKYLGETEKRIARMFEHAERDGALLLLDEADGFLAERGGARHAWEVTQVNELLTQMEQFEGVFVCCTNLLDHLDRAALRRFALKVAFTYLSRAQARALFAATLRSAGPPDAGDSAPATVLGELDRLRVLTPGDFAAVVRRVRLLDAPLDARALLSGLARECELKRVRGGRALGFGV